jgi:hypothetical protein
MRSSYGALGWLVVLGASALGCGGSDGAAGVPGERGAPGAAIPGGSADPAAGGPSAGIIVPPVGLLDRELDVQIAVHDGALTTAPSLDFGPGIRVSKTELVSESTVKAHLRVDASAALGERDVVIATDQRELVAAHGFNVLPPVDVRLLAGRAEQGGLAVLDIKNRDVEDFDPETFELLGDGMVVLDKLTVTTSHARVLVAFEPGARLGMLPTVAVNGSPPDQTFLADPAALTIKAREPAPFAAPPANDTMAEFESRLYRLSVPAGSAALMSVNIKVAQASEMAPAMLLYPPSGKFADALMGVTVPVGIMGPRPPPYDLTMTIPVPAGDAPSDFILHLIDENGGGKTHAFDLATAIVPATSVVEIASHATAATAQALAIPAPDAGALVIAGAVETADALDVYKFDADGQKSFEIALAPDYDASLAVTDDKLSFGDSKYYTEPKAKKVGNVVFKPPAGAYYVALKAAGAQPGKYRLSIREKIAPATP